MRSRLSGAFRALSVSVAFFVVLSHLASFLHFIVVSHSLCPEHGELVHASAGHETAEVAASASERVRGQVVERSSDVVDNDGHDHCELWSERREHAVLRRASSIAPPDLGSGLTLVRDRGARLLSSVPLYVLAPKNSPPV
jgi:hypothetical protein